jgi:pyruvyltransferase
VVRHSEIVWRSLKAGAGVRLIDLASGDVETVTREIMSCKRIISSSLHGLVIADAYGIPNAWLGSDGREGGSRPNGGEYKFYDYFAAVSKIRHAQYIDVGTTLVDADALTRQVIFDGRPLDFDYRFLLDSCPFLQPSH